MDLYFLEVESNSVGGYFSSEQLEMLSIVQCQTPKELRDFISGCHQFSAAFIEKNSEEFESIMKSIADAEKSIGDAQKSLDAAKKKVFECYQKTFVPHLSSERVIIENLLQHLGIPKEDAGITDSTYPGIAQIMDNIKRKYPDQYKEMLKEAHKFVSLERDQNKMDGLYKDFVLLNELLSSFDTLLVGSVKPEIVINNNLGEEESEHFDFYFAERDLDFALRNNKHVRLHSLFTKAATDLFKGKSKEEIIRILKVYVKTTIDFINEYNSKHKLADGSPVITAIDLFNEIVSFDKNSAGVYENIWESQYGITIEDICEIFSYAKEHKPPGVSYLYNEPFLENKERRDKVFEVLKEINNKSRSDKSGGLIDTLGSQMHITFGTSIKEIEECFEDFKYLQGEQGIHIQITEFDLSLGSKDIDRVIGDKADLSYDDVYDAKRRKISEDISPIIRKSGVRLSGVSYWSLTDNVDCNLERVRTNLLGSGRIHDASEVPTVCGGLMPTSSVYSKLYRNPDLQNDESKII